MSACVFCDRLDHPDLSLESLRVSLSKSFRTGRCLKAPAGIWESWCWSWLAFSSSVFCRWSTIGPTCSASSLAFCCRSLCYRTLRSTLRTGNASWLESSSASSLRSACSWCSFCSSTRFRSTNVRTASILTAYLSRRRFAEAWKLRLRETTNFKGSLTLTGRDLIWIKLWFDLWDRLLFSKDNHLGFWCLCQNVMTLFHAIAFVHNFLLSAFLCYITLLCPRLKSVEWKHDHWIHYW